MVAVSWAVQAHPKRAALASALASQVGGEVCWDPDPSGYRSPWRTFRHLLETTPAWATHRAQIQDDAKACPELAAAVELAVAARPDDLLVLYVGGNPAQHAVSCREACARGECFAMLDPAHWVPCVSTVWPVGLIPSLLDFYDAQGWPPEFTGDDEIVGKWVRSAGIRPVAVVPSLVQHENVVDSIVRKKIDPGPKRTPVQTWDSGRMAALYVGDCDCDPLSFDWGAGRF